MAAAAAHWLLEENSRVASVLCGYSRLAQVPQARATGVEIRDRRRFACRAVGDRLRLPR
jgi:hypothetical protein